MKILMVSRSTLFSTPGGDTIQMLETAEHLKQLGITVDIKLSNDKSISYTNYSLIHFFNVIRPADILPHIVKTSIPYVVSTIYVDYSEFERYARKGLLGYIQLILSSDQVEYLKAIARFVFNGEAINSPYYLFFGHKASIKRVLRNAKILLPNSHNEYNRLFNSYRINVPYRKVPNAISTSVFKRQKNVKTGVLCVGRIEQRKNQLKTIQALKGTGLNLTIIGNPGTNDLQYYEECQKEGKGWVKFINHVAQTELISYYNMARVHVLASWFETTGLSSLEAAACGCNIVITKKGDTEEYFGDFGFYCEPDDISSIRDAVLMAYNTPFNEQLSEQIVKLYNWTEAAKETAMAYEAIINAKANG